jgi:hypothetical protein
MGKRLRPFWQSPGLRFHLALAFLIWSLVPHFRLIIHSHGGAGDGHAHAALSAGEIELADQALQALPSAEPREFGGGPVDSPGPIAGAGGESWNAGPELPAHAHFHQDTNTVSALPVRLASAASPSSDSSHPPLYRAPVPAVPDDRPARGPPASFRA